MPLLTLAPGWLLCCPGSPGLLLWVVVPGVEKGVLAEAEVGATEVEAKAGAGTAPPPE